jgi:hypothetical protein
MMLQSSQLSPISNVDHEDTTLFLILNQHFDSYFNKARIKLMSLFILSLVKIQTVNFNQLSNAFDSSSKSDSSLRRIQRFFVGSSVVKIPASV